MAEVSYSGAVWLYVALAAGVPLAAFAALGIDGWVRRLRRRRGSPAR